MIKKRLKLGSATEVRRALNRVANMVLNKEIDPKEANSIILACNTILSSIKAIDQEQTFFNQNRVIAIF